MTRPLPPLILRCCLLAATSAIPAGCANDPAGPGRFTPAVETLGANANFAKGDFGSYANLADLRQRRHLYAVGPVQHLGGEVMVIDSVPYAVQVEDGKLKVSSTWELQPPFLAYSQVAKWRKIPIPEGVHTYADFEKWISAAAEQQGLTEGRPFAFRFRARPSTLTVTVMNRPATAVPGDKPTRAYQTIWNVGGQDTEFVGFYSAQHTGVFLGTGERVHIHAITLDRKIAGHVQDFALPAGGEILLPQSR